MTGEDKISQKIFYGWYVVAAGTLCILAGLGLGRFALGMVLPSMGRGLALTATQMGIISTANFGGYLAAVLGCLAMGPRIRPRRLITLALILTGGSWLSWGEPTGS